MGNCLKTQLKEVVNNDNLNEIGFFKFKINVPNNLSDYSDYWIRIENSPGTVISVPQDKNIYIYNSTTGEIGSSRGSSTTLTSTTATFCFADAGEYYVKITKYSITKIRLPFAANYNIENLDYTPLTSLFIYTSNTEGTFKGFSQLDSLTISSERGINEKFSISLNNLLKSKDLTSLTIYSYPLEGNIKSLGQLSKIEYLFTGGTNLSGSIEDFVRSQISKGKTDKSIVWQRLNGSSITFNNHNFSSGYNTTFSWRPSSTTGKTIITNGSESVEINNV